MRSLNYNHLYYFWTVAREGTIARAAEVLHLTPQTISGQLGEFEVRLDARLFKRNGRRLILTDVGQTVFDYADNIFQLGNELTDVLNRDNQSDPQTLKVGMVDMLPPLLTYQLITPAFANESINIVCRSGKMDTLLSDLSLQRLDIVISDTPSGTDGDNRTYNHHLGDSGISFFTAADRVKQYRGDFPASLNDAPMLLPTMNTPLRRSLEQWFRQADIAPHVTGEIEDSTLQRYIGENGTGIFVMPTVIKNKLTERYPVGCIGDLGAILESYYLISQEKRLQNPASQAILENARNRIFSGSISTERETSRVNPLPEASSS